MLCDFGLVFLVLYGGMCLAFVLALLCRARILVMNDASCDGSRGRAMR